jgi:hypothetical protein
MRTFTCFAVYHGIPGVGVIDLENFIRGWNDKAPTKGKTLYSANVVERPYFEQFQRPASYPVVHRFMGFFGGDSDSAGSGYDSDPDEYYIQNPDHKSKFSREKKYDVSELHHAIGLPSSIFI